MKKIIFILLMTLSITAKNQTLIKILDNQKLEDQIHYVLMYELYVPIPIQFYGLPDKVATLNSFMPLYPGLDRLDGNYVVFKLNDTLDYTATDTSIRNLLNFKYSNYVYGLNNIIITTPDYMKGEIWDGTTWQCQN